MASNMKYLKLFVFSIFPLALFAQEKVFYNARIFTADIRHPFAEAIAIKEKKILSVGSYDDVKKSAGISAEWIDCKGNFLMPGFVDSHNHGIGGGRGLTKANSSDKLLSIDELVAYAKDVLKKKEGMTGDVLVIFGINISTWSQLDEIILKFNAGEFVEQPVVLRGSDGHTSWANNVMMKRAGLNKLYIQSLKPEEKIFFGTQKDGEPNGFISESGYQKIAASLKVETDFSNAAEKTMEYNNRYGITALLDPAVMSLSSSRINYLDWYQYLVKNNKLTAHIAACIVADADKDPQPQITRLKEFQKKYNAENFSIIGFKIFADGVIEHPTHTAALSLPYTGTQSKGVLMFDPEKFTRFAITADKQNLLVHVHAIGDKAVTETLNGFEAVRKTNGNYKLPHTITHLQIVLPSDFDRFGKLNVLASYQLLWAFGDVTTIDIVKPYIDPSLYKWQYPARSLLQAGATICGASDWPVSSANPFEAIYNAETRLGPLGVLDSTQCMPRMDMLYAYTINSAKALMAEKNIGSLEPGKSADMILLDRDILTVTPQAMRDTRVLWTLFEGKKVYSSEKK
jgi:predicted amidohydrolase YtcJ